MLLPSFRLFGQEVSEKKIFRNWPMKNKNRLRWPCLLADQDKMTILYRGHRAKFRFIRASIFRGKYFRKRLPIRKKELLMAAMSVNGLGQNEHSLLRTFHWCLIPSFNSFGQVVSVEKIYMWKVNGRRTADDRRQVKAKYHFALARWAKKCWSHSTEIDKCIILTENNYLQSMIPETIMTSGIYVYK